MNKNGNVASFPQQNVPIVGQPVSLVEIECVRLDGKVHCNCLPTNPVLIVTNGLAKCEACGKSFLLLFNPTAPGIELRVVAPVKEGPQA
jgi:hypothetical protein